MLNRRSLLSLLLLPILLVAATCVSCDRSSAARGSMNERSDTLADVTSSIPATPLGDDFHRGVNHAHVHKRGLGYGSETSATELDSLKRIGVNAIAITPFGYQEGAMSDRIVGFPDDPTDTSRMARRRRGGDPSMTEDDLVAEIASAHRLGMKVTLKPHLWSHDFWGGGAWHGTVNQTTPERHARWWSSYRAFALHYAAVAERAGADLYCIGTELVEMTTRYPDEWRALIADIRKVYHGPLSYAAHWDRELDSISFWDALDYIGITAYFPLDASDSAGVDELVTAWQPAHARIEKIAERFDRPVLFLEAGYRPVAGTHREPWLYDGGSPDPDAQARAYEALFRTFSGDEWWRGVYIWKTFTDPDRAGRHGEDMGFSFRRLPGEGVVRRWFLAGRRDER